MKRRLLSALIAGAVSMALFTYFQGHSGGLDLARTKGPREYSDPAKVIEAGAGRAFVIVLESNPTTGYSWHLAGSLDKTILKVVEIKHSTQKTKKIGAGGKDLWTLQGLQPGEAEAAFEYSRSWEKNVPPVKRAVFTIRIKK